MTTCEVCGDEYNIDERCNDCHYIDDHCTGEHTDNECKICCQISLIEEINIGW